MRLAMDIHAELFKYIHTRFHSFVIVHGDWIE